MIDFKFGYINYLILSKSFIEFSYLKYPRHMVDVKKEKVLFNIIEILGQSKRHHGLEMIKFIYREMSPARLFVCSTYKLIVQITFK